MRLIRTVVVDDQTAYRHALEWLVRSAEGFELTGSAGSGEAAIEIAAIERPDLILMDHRLPGLSGAQATRVIVDRHPGTIVLLVSVYDRAELPREVDRCGAQAFVPKHEMSVDRLAAEWRRANGEVLDESRSVGAEGEDDLAIVRDPELKGAESLSDDAAPSP